MENEAKDWELNPDRYLQDDDGNFYMSLELTNDYLSDWGYGDYEGTLMFTTNVGEFIVPVHLLITVLGADNDPNIPSVFSVSENYPNPFNPNTQFHYSLTNTENIYLAIYDLLGREIYTIHSGLQHKGAYNVQWTGVNNQGDLVPSGVYICRLKTEVEILSKKMVL